jgi:hypothetical protein
MILACAMRNRRKVSGKVKGRWGDVKAFGK